MPELSQLKGIGFQNLGVSILKPDWEHETRLTPDLSGMARGQMFDDLSKTLQDLPTRAAGIISARRKMDADKEERARKIKDQEREDKKQAEQEKTDAIINERIKSGDLSGITLRSSGGATLSPERPRSESEAMTLQLRTRQLNELDRKKQEDEDAKGAWEKRAMRTRLLPGQSDEDIVSSLTDPNALPDTQPAGAPLPLALKPDEGIEHRSEAPGAGSSSIYNFPSRISAVAPLGNIKIPRSTPKQDKEPAAKPDKDKDAPSGQFYDKESDRFVWMDKGRVTHEQFREWSGPRAVAAASKEDAAKDEGRTFASIDEAKAAAEKEGFDLTGAKLGRDGSVHVQNYKPAGTDIKGRGKITDTQKSKITSDVILATSASEIQGLYDDLYSKGKAGMNTGGGWQAFKKYIRKGDEDYVAADGIIKVDQFKIARMLNGPGVLTESDLKRAQAVAPSLLDDPAQFRGKMRAVKSSLASSLESNMSANAGQLTEEQIVMMEAAIKSLKSGASGKKDDRPTINSQAEYDALPSGTKYYDSAGNPATKP